MSALYPELYPQIFACLDMVTAVSMRLVCRAFVDLPLPDDPELKKKHTALSGLVIKDKNTSLSFLSLPKACCLMGYEELFWEAILPKQVALPNGADAVPLRDAETSKLFDDCFTPNQQEMQFKDYYNAAIIGGSENIFLYLEDTLKMKPTKECIYLCAKYQRQEIAGRILKQPIPKDLTLRSRTIAVPDADWLPNHYRDVQKVDQNTLQYAIEEGNYALIPKLIKPKSVTWEHVLEARYMLHSSCDQAKAAYQLLLAMASRKGYTCALQTVLALDDLELYKKESKSKSWKLEFIPQQAIIKKAYLILTHIFEQPITSSTSLLEQLQLLKKHNYTVKDRSLVAHAVHEAELPALNFLNQELGSFLALAKGCLFPAAVKEFTPELLDFLHEHIPVMFKPWYVEEILKKNGQVFLKWIEQRLIRNAPICDDLRMCLHFYPHNTFSLTDNFTSTIGRYDLVECMPYAFVLPENIIRYNALRCFQYGLRNFPHTFQTTGNPELVHPRLKYELKKFKSGL